MAKVEDLIDEIADPVLRERIAHEVKDLKETKRFGLVFEEHIPETVSLHGLPIRPGLIVQNRTTPQDLTEFQVLSVEGDEATLVPKGADEPEVTVDVTDLLVVKRFHEQIFPGLTPVGTVRRGADDKPAHVVINGENFHALQVLTYTHAGNVDCIYIDPPYNTGARDWKYNNSFVDANDRYRHSKWLSFMEKRLKLAKRLLRPDDSVLLVTIDDNEVYSLGLLLDQVFQGCERQMVSITVSPRGKSRDGRLSQVDEYLIVVYLGGAAVANQQGGGKSKEVRWRYLRRNDVESARGTVKGGPRQFYPIYVDNATHRIVKIGGSLAPDEPLDSAPAVSGTVALFPIRDDGKHMNWGLTGSSLQRALDGGYVRVTPGTHAEQAYTISYLTGPNIKKVEIGALEVTGLRLDGSRIVLVPGGKVARPTTAWRETRYDAGAHGTTLLRSFVPDGKFPYPKSLYAVEDTLRLFVGNKPEALILDFFGGSGTTAHAVIRLNHQDGGTRRCITVTNNEVSVDEAKRLRDDGHSPGDRDWEALGIFSNITRPRIEAAVTGRTRSGTKIEGDYRFTDEFPMADGFEANVEFFRLDYLDPDKVELGRQFNAIVPMLWMAAESVGQWEEWDGSAPWSLPKGSTYGVLFDEDHLSGFAAGVDAHASVTHVWLVTNSHAAFVEMRQALPDNLVEVRQLYRDYLRNFTVNAPGVLRT